MKKENIINLLVNNYKLFIDYIEQLPDEDFLFAKGEKWTAAQQLDHINLAVKPLVQALRLPKFLLKQIFGKANRQSKSYDDLIKKYTGKLNNGGKATGKFIPPVITLKQKEKLLKSLSRLVKKLTSKINNYSEDDLDMLILPHPLLGKLTLREMLYFTIYHVEHHNLLTKKYLERSTEY